jgi:signal transduction histidine kinase/CheY-like chemotaxis protein/HPt (histidine-containing phosphotransfer) domain-containing protein
MNLLAALGYAVFERTGEASFRLSGPAPNWLPPGCLTEAFPFLEVFLPDAEAFWVSPGDRSALYSDLWTQNDLHCCAIAVAGEQKFLLIHCAEEQFQQTQSFAQYAHETALARDQIAKLSHQLKRATQAKSEFLARMSHEIRTPLNALIGMAELLSGTPLNNPQREYVRVFRRAGDSLLSIVNDILDFSKIEAGQIELEQIEFKVADVLAETLEIADISARAKGLKLNSRIGPEVPPRWIGDPGRLRQILLNLLGNAVKFTERGGIGVSVAMDPDQQLHFAISDTGIGIPTDRISTIFESYSQVEASTTRKYGGSGLGLAICKRFVELMGGKIWAQSTPEAGTTMHFTVRFAIAPPATGVAEPELAPASAHPLAEGALRILLADDSEENRFLICGYLEQSGCVIDEVENGALAVERFKQGAYDVVLMDAQMPVMDGYEATREMRAFERERGRASTPIFALTAHALREARDRSHDAGFTGHLTKPIKKATLLEALGRCAPVDPNRISVEAWLQPVVNGYLEKRRDDVETLRGALQRGDFPLIRTLGHRMAGSGGGYGFDRITEIGSALEESAHANDATQIRAGIDELDRYLDNIRME